MAKKKEMPKDLEELADAYNKRLDFEAESDRVMILFTNQVGIDCAIVFGGKPPLDRRARFQHGK